MRASALLWIGLLSVCLTNVRCQQINTMPPPTTFPQRPCHGQWVSIPQASACVWYSHIKADWISANTWCQMLGGYLVEMIPLAKNHHAAKNIPTNRQGNYWIGLSNIEDSHVYRWMHSKQVLSPIEVVRPDNPAEPPAPTENCVALNVGERWLNRNCNEKNWFICER